MIGSGSGGGAIDPWFRRPRITVVGVSNDSVLPSRFIFIYADAVDHLVNNAGINSISKFEDATGVTRCHWRHQLQSRHGALLIFTSYLTSALRFLEAVAASFSELRSLGLNFVAAGHQLTGIHLRDSLCSPVPTEQRGQDHSPVVRRFLVARIRWFFTVI